VIRQTDRLGHGKNPRGHPLVEFREQPEPAVCRRWSADAKPKRRDFHDPRAIRKFCVICNFFEWVICVKKHDAHSAIVVLAIQAKSEAITK
jgi:hypothetical protein